MSCPKKEVELILWCRNWVAVYKREKFLSDWTYDSSSDEYSDWLWSLWRTPWECQAAISQKDPEIVCMTNDGGETVVKWVVIFSYDWTNWTSTVNNLDGSVATGYTVIPCATANQVEEWEVRCDGGINIVPFYDVETDWAASANVAFWFNPVTNSVVVPSGSQIPWACTIKQVTADHANGCIERTTLTAPTSCESTTEFFSFSGTDFIDFTITANDWNGNYTAVQTMTPSAHNTFLALANAVSVANTRTVLDVAWGALILNYHNGNFSNVVDLSPTSVQMDLHYEVWVTDTPTPLTTPCADPVADSAYISSWTTLRSIYDSYTVWVPQPNWWNVITYSLTHYVATPWTLIEHIPAKQVLTYDINWLPVSDRYFEQGTLTEIAFNPATDVFKNVCTKKEDIVPSILEKEVCWFVDGSASSYQLIRLYTRDATTWAMTIIGYEDIFWNIVTWTVVETCCTCSSICWEISLAPIANRRSDSYAYLMAQQKDWVDDTQYDTTYAGRWPVWAPRNHYYEVKVFNSSNTQVSTAVLWPYAVDPSSATYLQFLADMSVLTASLWVEFIWTNPVFWWAWYQVEYNDATGFGITLRHGIDNHAWGIIRNPDIKQCIYYNPSVAVIMDSINTTWDFNNPALDAWWREWTNWRWVVANNNVTII